MPIGSRTADPTKTLQRTLVFNLFYATTFPDDYHPYKNDGRCADKRSNSVTFWYIYTPFNSDKTADGANYNDSSKPPGPDFHPGEDWNGGKGSEDACQPVYPIAKGVVIGKGFNGPFGNSLFILHRLVGGEFIISVYAHLNEEPSIALGVEVDTCTPVGRVGRSGKGAQNAYHLHWEIRRDTFLLNDGSTIALKPKTDLKYKPDRWPATGSTDNGKAFIDENYYGPSELVKARALLSPSISFREFPGINGHIGLTAGPDEALWFTEATNGKIGRITTTGVFTDYPLPNPAAGPLGITAGPDGALWFTEYYGGNKVGRITTAGLITEYAMIGASAPLSITTGPDEALWFTDAGAQKVGRITTAGVITLHPVLTPYGIVAGRDGALWFTESGYPKIGRITTSGAVAEYPIDQPSLYITSGPDGALWFTQPATNRIGRITTAGGVSYYSLPSTGSYPYYITRGPDEALWFTELFGNRIGRITTCGVITEYTVPTPNSQPTGIATGSDGAIWFVESGTGKIGKATLTFP
jgi:virginiamycin B lyase